MSLSLESFLFENKIPFQNNVSLSNYTTFRTGGVCRIMISPDNQEKMIILWNYIREHDFIYHILGNGSDTLAPDNPGDDIYISTSLLKSILIDYENRTIEAGCGALLSGVAAEALSNGYSGFEALHGIPGSVGGGLVLNAGAYGTQISDIILKYSYINFEGKLIERSPQPEEFGYRKSPFSRNDLILSSVFFFKEVSQTKIRELMREFAFKRRSSQPLEYPSAGSVFKRPEGYFAGKLIQDAGLKGLRIGGAEVSEKHAGFIINIGNATSSDVIRLMETVRNQVKKEFNVDLYPEIRIIESGKKEYLY